MDNIDTNASGPLVPEVSEDSVDIYDGLEVSSNAALVPAVNEDSVDIYEGLDMSIRSNAEKSSSKASEVKESMDLYEEIVMEEQQTREASYTELKSRFQAAQTLIKDLHRRLEQMEIQNTGLNTENCHLKKNISALLQTARQEVTRKDAEIQRLNLQSERGRHHHQSHISNLRDQNPSSRTSMTRPPPPLPPPPPPPSSPPPPPPPPPPSLPRDDHPSRDTPQPSRKESSSFTYQPSGSNRKSSRSLSTRHSESDKHKSKHREEKCQSQKLSESTDRRHRSGSDPSKDCHAPERNRSHKADKETGWRYDSRSCKSRNYLNVEGHHRSNGAKSPPPEISHSAVSSDDKKGRSRDRRQDTVKTSTSDSEHSAAHSSKEGHNRDHRKIKTSDRHARNSDPKDQKKPSSNQHVEHCRELSKVRGGDRLSKDYQRKEERRREDETSRKHRRSAPSETSREREKARSKESDQGKDVSSKRKQEKTHKALKSSSEEPHIGEKNSVEESSPNRKLCFMETLNLTLSPIKKPGSLVSACQADVTPVDEVVENGPDDDSSQLNIEDICVIDEVNSSELEAGLKEQSLDIPETPSSEKTHERCDDAIDIQETDKKQSETPATDKQPEDNSVQTTSLYSQRPDTAETQVAEHLALTSPEMSSPKATDNSRNHENQTTLASDSQVVNCGPLDARAGDSDMSGNISEQHKDNSSQKVTPVKRTDQSVAVTDPDALVSSIKPTLRSPKTPVQKSHSVDSVDEAASTSQENPVAEDVPDKASQEIQQIFPTVLPEDGQQGLVASTSTPKKDDCQMQDGPKDADAVSSTISLESLPQEGLSLYDAICMLAQTNDDTIDSSSTAAEPSSSTGCIAVSKVSSTTEDTALPEKYSDLTHTPKKSFSPGKSHGNNVEPSSSVPLLHDEDSMMHTLNNLKRIPDAISPLRSPIKITKRSHPHVQGKPGHVKSLQKDFSSTAVDANSKKLDINKENKYPGTPANHDTQNLVDKVSDLPSSDTDLEEGEILSESDEAAPGSSLPANKKAKLARPVRNKQSPKSVLKRKSEERSIASKETIKTACVSTRSPKSRFKTVCPAATKASFSTIEEVMETFKAVRTEIRRKYMKLHKTFPKKSFHGMMDNFQESFLEFVDGAHFGQICSQAGELKSKLKKMIASVFSKVTNNGIVKRIFEQQAVDLKQRLWDFVDVQVNYLFKDIYMTLKSLCKPARTQAEDSRPKENEKVSRQSPVKKPQCQQKEAQSSQTSLNQNKPCAVVPYKTGLGSRGKDIRITHVEKDSNVDPHPTNGPNTKTVANFLPPKDVPSTPEKSNVSSLVISQNGSLLDRTDFELLTEQQASSLTFNLVRDTQMGEIFKCLLQGSDLLETSTVTGDNTPWPLGTPRKDGERLISITTPIKFDSPSKLLSPTKFDSPSKLIATWSSISPRKMSSPRPKAQIQLNPALFDESCLLEVPSENRSQRSYSILAEDLAVSLTIPSPLKSDSHLSFLQPPSMHLVSTPDSVISAHISEDALLDGEDASEQDIHLALDTDNSSCGSSTSSEVLATPFVFKPNLPMQALVMERSNDHFIVKIRQASTGTDTTLTPDDSLSQTLTEEDQQRVEDGVETKDCRAEAVLSDKPPNSTPSNAVPSNAVPLENSLSGICNSADVHLTQDESLTPHEKQDLSTQQNTSKVSFSENSQKLSETLKKHPKTIPSDNNLHNNAQSSDHAFGNISQPTSREDITVTAVEHVSQTYHRNDMTSQSPSKSQKSPKRIGCSETVLSDISPHHPAKGSETDPTSEVLTSHVSDGGRDEMEAAESERSLVIAEDISSTPEKDHRDCEKGGKRKKKKHHHEKSKAKRFRTEEEERTEEMMSNCKADDDVSKSLSPTNLYAKNVIRKKGEVVIAWTRDEDRAILIELKTKGASRETFSALAEKLNKPSGQIAQRFHQLMKLFKKQEKMDT